MVAAILLERKFAAGLILRGNRAQAQRTDIGAARKLRLRQYLRPGEHCRAGKQRRDVASAVDRRDVEGIRKPVERERARERNDVPAIDQTAAETVLALGELVEVNARGVLVKPRRYLVLGFLDG